MKRYLVFFIIFGVILFVGAGCTINVGTNSENKKTENLENVVPDEQKPDVQKPDDKNPENDGTTEDLEGQGNGGGDENAPLNPDDTEDKKPEGGNTSVIPSQNPNKENYIEPQESGGIKPYPDDIINKVKKFRPKYEFDGRFMYLMIRFKGTSEKNELWKQKSERKEDVYVYPRGFVLGYTDIHTNQYAETHLNGYDNDLNPIPEIGYDKDSGFTNGTGMYLLSNFFYGNEHLRTPIYGNSDIMFNFNNFVIWDPLDNGIGLMGHPAFVRLNESHPLKIIVPMKDYNPTIHKNIAYITVYFDLDKGTLDNPYPYQAVFDGFEPKNKGVDGA